MERENMSMPQAGGSASGKGIFLWGLTVGAGVLAVGVYQVPQPWRGWLIGWLLFMFTLGLLIVRILRHYYQYKVAQLMRPGAASTSPRREGARAVPRVDNLKVVVLNKTRGGRFTLR